MVLGVIVLLIVGNLVIKYIRESTGKIPSELLTGTNSTELNQKVHVVKKGDNLWNMALTYYGDGFKWVEIATENKLDNASVIEEGQELVIPNLDNKLAEDLEKETVSSTYEVVKGDSLWSIAVKEYGDGYKWVEIAKVNNLSHPDLIHSGNILMLPR